MEILREQAVEGKKQQYVTPEVEAVEIDLTETMRMTSGWVDD
jgi:hypothetical protein